ncbi:D-alanyl-D-alanine carboxypeptidase [Rhizobiales bacterium L72]|uniref:D-alanyl-D-alanine carboxypeptidase n=1 Tax=Propylenella binzhouense TaxID=2555902 RepID=A0A964WS75_9HYPH|nr:D-alanyl-D-alanine carboxypeptidase [Propylenella binzhouense]
MRRLPSIAFALAVVLSLLSVAAPASAAERYAALVVDAKSGETLYERYADEPRYPASLTKMMTLYILFEEMSAGRVTLDTQFTVSKYAASMPPSKLGIPAGRTIRVEDAIKALCVKSANDIAVVVAENIEGSVEAFARRMNRTARAIGMSRTTFNNPNGLPDPTQKTTARDMARLGRALQDRFPRYFAFFSTRTFTWGRATYRNTNHLLGTVDGVEGIKTGYTRASGFNLVTSVKRGDRRIVAVVLGGATSASRNAHMKQLIADYLPDASRGKRTAPLLIADTGAISGTPLPRIRPGYEPPALLASAEIGRPAADEAMGDAVVAVASAVPNARPDGIGGDQIAARIMAAQEVAQLAYAPAVSSSHDDPIARLAELAQSKAAHMQPRPRTAAEAASLAPSSRAGWQIQIAAVPSREDADALLEKVSGSARAIVRDREPFTMPVNAGGTTLYRVRFAGFEGKDEARAACRQLKRQSITCLAVPN